MTKEIKPRIAVFGIGGAGGNAVDNMINSNLQGVEFHIANTDAQAMMRSKTENRIQLGIETTAGLGAGARPEIGEASAEESMPEIEKALEGKHMIFIAAGMGGGTGTGAAPVIARTAHERDILTIGVVTKPFAFEGTHRMKIAEEGLEKIQGAVDTLIVVPNQNLFRIVNERTTFSEAFRMADDVLYSGVRGITDLMVMPGLINLDFADVRTIMKGMGPAMMGMGEGEGEGRALDAARMAIDNPLLDNVSMKGARGVLINITGGYDMTLFELDEAANEVRREVDTDANIILGSTFDPELEGRVRVSVVAAGLGSHESSIPVPDTHATPPVAAEVPIVIAPIAATMADPKHADENTKTPPTNSFADRAAPDLGDQAVAEAPVQHDAPSSRPVTDDVATQQSGALADDAPGFANLFGWRQPGTDDDRITKRPAPEGSRTPRPTPFDDEDLEIPAFLRRSGNP